MFIEKLKDSEIKEFFAQHKFVVANINKVYNDKGKLKNMLVFVSSLEETLIEKHFNSFLRFAPFGDYADFKQSYFSRVIYVTDKHAIELFNVDEEHLDLSKEWKTYILEKKQKLENNKNVKIKEDDQTDKISK